MQTVDMLWLVCVLPAFCIGSTLGQPGQYDQRGQLYGPYDGREQYGYQNQYGRPVQYDQSQYGRPYVGPSPNPLCERSRRCLYETIKSAPGPHRTAKIKYQLWLVSVYCSATVYGQCNCQPAVSCPQPGRGRGRPGCLLPDRSPGVCCPPGQQTGGGGYGGGGGCVPLALCPSVASNPMGPARSCQLSDGSPGVVCQAAVNPLASGAASGGGPLGATPGRGVPGRGAAAAGPPGRQPAQGTLQNLQPMRDDRLVSQSFVISTGGNIGQQAAAAGAAAVQETISASNQLQAQGAGATLGSSTGVFNLNFQSTNEAQSLGLAALQNLETLAAVGPAAAAAGFAGGGDQALRPVQAAGSEGTGVQQSQTPSCTPEPPVSCTNSIYRTITGECNNLQEPRRGRSLTGFKRLLPNTFEDGLFAIRSNSVTGQPLPSSRRVSERVVDTFSNELRGFTLSVMQWGQFIDHDFAHALIFRLDSGAGIECCENDGQTLPQTPRHPQCIPIDIPVDDPFYSQFNQRCMNLVRSLPAPEPDCVSRPAKPLNELTSYLDASNVYGSQPEESELLRAFRDGLLRTSPGDLLPFFAESATPLPRNGGRVGSLYSAPRYKRQVVETPCVADICFRAGDTRVNEQSALAVIHTIFLREHNRIAGVLKQNHLDWDDEKLFQEARRILIAEWQHILYNEWLPIVIGFQYAREHGLLPLEFGFSFFYSPSIDATLSTEFASTAFRFGHSMVREMYDLLTADGQVKQVVNVTRTFFEPSVVSESFVEHARTLVARRPETFERNVVPALHEQLFTTNFIFGLDLITLNIQRGRDHGIPTYTSMLEACTGVQVQNWGDLNQFMDGDNIDRLRSLYISPLDVDLFIGGLAERLAPGAQVGTTFQCLLGQQFFDLRFGDRFFYDNGGFAHSLTPQQLAEIRKSSWARMMCDTLGPQFGNDFTRVQPLAFVEPGPFNPVFSCNSAAIPKVNLNVF